VAQQLLHGSNTPLYFVITQRSFCLEQFPFLEETLKWKKKKKDLILKNSRKKKQEEWRNMEEHLFNAPRIYKRNSENSPSYLIISTECITDMQ
jgi:hypothetical protein